MIHLIVGNTGAGKSTYALRLKNDSGGVIFSIDHWNKTLFLPDRVKEDGLDWFLERIERAESVILNLIGQLEEAGVDSILDLGLSKFSHREKFRKFAAGNDFGAKVHFLDIDGETRWERILHRNRTQGDTFEFEVSREDFEFMESWFESPTDSEMVGGIVIRNN